MVDSACPAQSHRGPLSCSLTPECSVKQISNEGREAPRVRVCPIFFIVFDEVVCGQVWLFVGVSVEVRIHFLRYVNAHLHPSVS
jgi:hypothetical protein